MNWKIKLIILFAKLRKPIDGASGISISKLRGKSVRFAKLGKLLFDETVTIQQTIDVTAAHFHLRIYKNSNRPNQPVIIYFHGGGFVFYGIESHDNVCRRLCQMNDCIVVSVDYRLAPEFTFPIAHEDAFLATQWVKNNISTYGGNIDQLMVAGDSAGGNLAACMAQRCKKENISLAAQILIYPWIDGKLENESIQRNGEGYLLTKETMFWFQTQYTPNPQDHCNPAVSPCYETDCSNLTPAFILTAEFDPLIDDGLKYAQQLKKADNIVKYKEYKGLVHGFFNIPKVDRESMQAYYDIQEFIRELAKKNFQ